MADFIDRNAVLEILNNLLDNANEIKACVGKNPTAQEALTWAISEIIDCPHSNILQEPHLPMHQTQAQQTIPA